MTALLKLKWKIQDAWRYHRALSVVVLLALLAALGAGLYLGLSRLNAAPPEDPEPSVSVPARTPTPEVTTPAPAPSEPAPGVTLTPQEPAPAPLLTPEVEATS